MGTSPRNLLPSKRFGIGWKSRSAVLRTRFAIPGNGTRVADEFPQHAAVVRVHGQFVTQGQFTTPVGNCFPPSGIR